MRGKAGPGQEGVTVAGFQACDDNSLHQGSSKKDWECKINEGKGRGLEARMMDDGSVVVP